MGSPKGKRGLMASFASVLFAAVLGVVLLAGCRGVQVYHSTDSVIHDAKTNFYTAFIELDDQGELLRPGQITNATAAIKAADPVFLVGYFHGWKNNASFEND